MVTRVFLSWSGEKSKMVARALKSGLKMLPGSVQPWLSEDMAPGKPWANELTKKISNSELAILRLQRYATVQLIRQIAGLY